MNSKLLLINLSVMTVIFSSCQRPEIFGSRKIASTKSPKYFREVTEEAGLPNSAASTIVVGDFNNDDLPDFIASRKLYKNISSQDRFNFDDVTEKTGLSGLKGNPLFVDINNDGLIDIASTSGQVFLQVSKNRFVESAKTLGLQIPENTFSLSFVDYNRDGFVDLVAGMSEIHKDDKFTFVPPHFYQNMGGKRFVEISKRFNFDKFSAYTRGIEWADYNNDGWADAYFSNYRLKQNFLFKNTQSNLTDVASQTNTQGEYNPKKYYDENIKAHKGPNFGHTIGSVWADFNNDGNFDLWVSNLVHKFVGQSNGSYDYRGYVCDDSKIYRNTGAPQYKFVDMRSASGIPLKALGDRSVYKGDELWAHSTAADFDNDGLVDMYVTQVYNLHYAHSLIYKNKGNFQFTDVSQDEGTRVLDSYAGAWADFNNDGKMDLLTGGREGVDISSRIRLFKNIYQSKNHYVKIRVIGTRSGKNPVTTQVRVVHDKGQFMRQVEGVTGTMNQQNDPTLHFGLGSVNKIKWVEVRWSSGQKQIFKNITPDKTWIVTEPK